MKKAQIGMATLVALIGILLITVIYTFVVPFMSSVLYDASYNQIIKLDDPDIISVANESNTYTSADANLTMTNTPVVSNSETLYWYNATSGNNSTLTENVNYSVLSYPSGTINVNTTAAGTNISILTSYNYEDDNEKTQIYGNLTAMEREGAESARDTFGIFFSVISLAAVFSVIAMIRMAG